MVIFRFFLSILIVICFISCSDGDNGSSGTPFQTFGIELRDFEFEDRGIGDPCPVETADMVLELAIEGNGASGFMTLVDSNNQGEPVEVEATVEGDNISFDPFEVAIVIQGATEPPAPPNAGGIAFIVDFSSFAGTLTHGDAEGIIEEINGAASGKLILILGDVIFCDRDVFTANFQAIAQ